MVPVKSRKTVAVNDTYIHILGCDNDIFIHDLAGVYMDDIKKTIQDMRDNNRSRYIFVSEDMNSIEKTALALSGVELNSDDEGYARVSDYRLDAGVNADNVVAVVSLRDKSCMKEVNACLEQCYRSLLIIDADKAESVQLAKNVIFSACETFDKVFVAMTERELNAELASSLVFEGDFAKLDVPAQSDKIYECVWEFLLQNDIYQISKDVSIQKLNRALHNRFGKMYSEEIIVKSLDMAIDIARADGRTELEERDFNYVLECCGQSVLDEINNGVGKENFKKAVNEYSALGMEMQLNPKLKVRYENIVFSGNPGTGKSTSAELLTKVMAEAGLGNGKLVTAERKDLIGSYLGQTAPKIAELFQSAKGGVLFVDEAGFLLNSDQYTEEAVREFVRYMEIYHDVSVVFALYPHEVEGLLRLDAGLSSRIKRIISFDDYSDDELIKISRVMFKEQGYKLDEDTEAAISEYICEQRKSEGEGFGNARSIRKLVDAVITVVSLRHIREAIKDKEKVCMVYADDIREAIKNINGIARNKTERAKIGFALD
jgi:AAA+ superfamily predicted ATPase